jgi:N-methylhydantoinase A
VAPPTPEAVAPEPFATDTCWFTPQAPLPTPRFERATLSPPHRVAGPAIIEDDWSTIVVPPGWVAAPDAQGNLLLLPQESA